MVLAINISGRCTIWLFYGDIISLICPNSSSPCYLLQWHLGMFAKQYTPVYRGFKSHFGFYQGCGDYYGHSYEASQVMCSHRMLFTYLVIRPSFHGITLSPSLFHIMLSYYVHLSCSTGMFLRHTPLPRFSATAILHIPRHISLPHLSVTFLYHIPLPHSSASFCCHIHLPHSSATYTLPHSSASFCYHIHLPHSSATFPCHIHLPHSAATFTYHIPLPHSPATFICFILLPHSPTTFLCHVLLPNSSAMVHCHVPAS